MNSELQGNKLLSIKSVAGNSVVVEIHRTMNQVKGTVYSEAQSKSTESEILDKLNEQGVTRVERMKKRINGQHVDTHRYILTFSRTKLPSLIKLAEWHREIIDLYTPTPLRCAKCQRLDHTKNWCRRADETCSRCGEVGHHASACTRAAQCVNCTGERMSTDRKCTHYLFKSEVLATQTREHITYREAEDRFLEDGKTHSFITKRSETSITTNVNSIIGTNKPAVNLTMSDLSNIDLSSENPIPEKVPEGAEKGKFTKTAIET